MAKTAFRRFQRRRIRPRRQNLFVSRAGVLQRIQRYDLNKDGYVVLIFRDSENHCEKPPAYACRNPLGESACIELPSEGARSVSMADLNGAGYGDLVLGVPYSGFFMILLIRSIL